MVESNEGTIIDEVNEIIEEKFDRFEYEWLDALGIEKENDDEYVIGMGE